VRHELAGGRARLLPVLLEQQELALHLGMRGGERTTITPRRAAPLPR
jgi:hypothetical protein